MPSTTLVLASLLVYYRNNFRHLPIHVTVTVPIRVVEQAQIFEVAKQLAAINFLREIMGTRKHNLESFIVDIARVNDAHVVVADFCASVPHESRDDCDEEHADGDGEGAGGGATVGTSACTEAVVNLGQDVCECFSSAKGRLTARDAQG